MRRICRNNPLVARIAILISCGFPQSCKEKRTAAQDVPPVGLATVIIHNTVQSLFQGLYTTNLLIDDDGSENLISCTVTSHNERTV